MKKANTKLAILAPLLIAAAHAPTAAAQARALGPDRFFRQFVKDPG